MTKKVPTILDNRSDNTLLNALKCLLPQTSSADIATGCFEIGSLLALDGIWQVIDRIRVIMGDETTRRTKKELIRAIRENTDSSIEEGKERDDNLEGIAAIRDAIQAKRLLARVYSRAKFHAKCQIMESKAPNPVDFAIVGSSNFTYPGLTKNIELNLFSTDQIHIASLREWFNEMWQDSESINAELLKVIEPHIKEYSPFTIYARALYEYFAGREKPQDEWEAVDSVIYPKLSKYQKDGYHRSLQIADNWNGALICDGVGLGKTFIGLMILERCIAEDKRVLLIVPKSAEKSVWRRYIDRYLSPRYRRYFKELFDIRRITDFGREETISVEDMEYYRKYKDVIIIDEAHHFRNPNSNRGIALKNLTRDKKLFMLTATPINNKLDDLYHLINYFAQDQPDYFSKIRINNLRRYFLDHEKRLESIGSEKELPVQVEDEDFLRTDELLKNVLIQRSRKYVKESESEEEIVPVFPVRQKPRVINYSLKNVYASIYGEVKEAFHKDDPLLSLAIYNTSSYSYKPDISVVNTQKQVIGLIRSLLLKRLESSFKSFEASLEDLLEKMARVVREYDPEAFEVWGSTNKRWWKIVQSHISERLEHDEIGEENEMPEAFVDFVAEEHDMERLLRDLQEDMRIITDFLSKIYRRFYTKEAEGENEDPSKDDKLQQLIEILNSEPLIKGNKLLVFTEFKDTARYLLRHLRNAGFDEVEQIDSARNVDRDDIIRRFAPYYNCYKNGTDPSNQSELNFALANPIKILISTDILSEGLNLQDASLLINYDLHWNPVRLMQRIGRVDRRLDPEIEQILDRPNDLEGKIYFWNFLPPNELEELLHLKQKLDGKILRINRTLGIEGALLTPDDEDSALKLFNERYEGKESIEELMNLERQLIEEQLPELWESLAKLPRRIYSGKEAGAGFEAIVNRDGIEVAHLEANLQPGLFCCYRMPRIVAPAPNDLFDLKYESAEHLEEEQGEVKWYFYDLETKKITEDLKEIWTAIRCRSETSRKIRHKIEGMQDARKAIEKHITNTYLRDIQAPVGSKPKLLAWMEIS